MEWIENLIEIEIVYLCLFICVCLHLLSHHWTHTIVRTTSGQARLTSGPVNVTRGQASEREWLDSLQGRSQGLQGRLIWLQGRSFCYFWDTAEINNLSPARRRRSLKIQSIIFLRRLRLRKFLGFLVLQKCPVWAPIFPGLDNTKPNPFEGPRLPVEWVSNPRSPTSHPPSWHHA